MASCIMFFTLASLVVSGDMEYHVEYEGDIIDYIWIIGRFMLPDKEKEVFFYGILKGCIKSEVMHMDTDLAIIPSP